MADESHEVDGATEEVNLEDGDVSARDAMEVAPNPRRSMPPPLPPDLVSDAPRAPAPPRASLAPAPQAPSPRSFALLLLGVVLFALLGGGGVAFYLRRASGAPTTSTSPPALAPTEKAVEKPSVITIPTVEMNDSPDAG